MGTRRSSEGAVGRATGALDSIGGSAANLEPDPSFTYAQWSAGYATHMNERSRRGGRSPLTRAVLAVLTTCGVLLAGLPGLPATAATSVTLLGHGYGHGRGLGQWGAYGYAVDQGWSAATILDHFYGGTTPGNIGNPVVTVRLTSLDQAVGTWITSAQGFSVGGRTVSAGSAARVVRDSNGWWLYTTFGGCAGTDNFGPYPLPASPEVRLDSEPGEQLGRMLQVCANRGSYRGTLRYVADGTATRLVNALPMQQYLRGVVPRESPASWGDAAGGRGMAALEAQAVAARSYAASERRHAYAQTCDTTSCQVYGGAATNGVRNEDPRTDRAVAATSGAVRLWPDGRVVRTEFSSSTGGWTAGPDFRRVQDLGDSRSPRHTWLQTLQGTAISARYPEIGSFSRLRVTSRDGQGVQGGRVLQVQVVGTARTVTVTGAAFRAAMGLHSDWFLPLDQVDTVRYVRTAYSDVVHKQVTAGSWQDHYSLSYSQYVAEGSPPVGTIRSDYVKYPWSSTVYAVTFWPGDPQWQWDRLTYEQWRRAGFPAVRNAGWIFGTAYYKSAASPEIYAEGPDGVVHRLTYAQWRDAGFPKPEIR